MNQPLTFDDYVRWPTECEIAPLQFKYIPDSLRSTWPETADSVAVAMTAEEKQSPDKITPARLSEISVKTQVSRKEIGYLISCFLAWRNDTQMMLDRISKASFWQRLKLLFGFTKVNEL